VNHLSEISIATAAKTRHPKLGDFTTTVRVLPISLLAMGIGALCAFVALALLRLIGLFTNLFYFERWSTALVSPAGNHLGLFSVLVRLKGVLTADDIRKTTQENGLPPGALMAQVKTETFDAFGDEPLRVVVNRMAQKGVTRMPVLERGTRKVLGIVSLEHVLKARARHQEQEVKRDRTLWLPCFTPARAESSKVNS
jgi:CBS domain-containing protein